MEKWLLWPDSHIPKENKNHFKVMFEVVKTWKPDYITFLGDLDDMEAPSRFALGTKDEVLKRLSKTIPSVNKFLAEIRQAAPKANMDWFMGNHEQRLIDYVGKNAKALDGFVNYELVYPLKQLGIKWYNYTDAPVKKFGDFYIHHGNFTGVNAGDGAKKEAERWGISGFSGHTHCLGSYRKRKIGGYVEWFECGHLSDIKKQGYVAEPNWQSGFAYAYIDGKTVYPFLAEFRGNKVVVDGTLFISK